MRESRSSSGGRSESGTRGRTRNGRDHNSRDRNRSRHGSREREENNSDTYTQIYVAKLDRHTREEELREAFSKFGKLKGVALKFNYAFIDYEDHESAAKAVGEMDGKTFVNGEKLVVE